jgi:hypothetical protein
MNPVDRARWPITVAWLAELDAREALNRYERFALRCKGSALWSIDHHVLARRHRDAIDIWNAVSDAAFRALNRTSRADAIAGMIADALH